MKPQRKPMGVVRNQAAETAGAAVAGIAQGLQEGIAQGEQTRQFEYQFNEKANMDRLAIKARMIEIAEGLRNAGQDRQVNARVNVRGQNADLAKTKYAVIDDKRKQDSAQDHADQLNRRDNAQRDRERVTAANVEMAKLYQAGQPRDASEAADRAVEHLAGVGKTWNEMDADERRMSALALAHRNSGGPAVFDSLPLPQKQQELYRASRWLASVEAIPKFVAPTEGAGATSPVTNPLGLGIGPYGANLIPDGQPGSLSGTQPAPAAPVTPDVPAAPGFLGTRTKVPMLDYFRADVNDINTIGRFDYNKIIEDGNVDQAVAANAFNRFLDNAASEAALMHSGPQSAAPESRMAMANARAAQLQGILARQPGMQAQERAALQEIGQQAIVAMFVGYETSDLGIVTPVGVNQNPNAAAVGALKSVKQEPTPGIQPIVPPVRPLRYKDNAFSAEPSDPSAPKK